MRFIPIIATLFLASASADTNSTLVDCRWSKNIAGFLVTFENQHTGWVKLRSCPKKYTDQGCTGDTKAPNAYIDCDKDLPPSSSTPVLVNVGVGYMVDFKKDTGNETQHDPQLPGGVEWPATIIVKQ